MESPMASRPLWQMSPSDGSGTSTPSPSPIRTLSSYLYTPSSFRDYVTTTRDSILSKEGVFITWENLSAAANNARNKRVQILDRLNGFARPREVLAVMGPSGCGKSSLLDALAGRLASNITQTGEILVNGKRQKLTFGTSAYVTQEDVLMTTLTVREAVYYSAQLQLPASMPLSEKKARAEETTEEMGLKGAMDTIIGGENSKGISGGQRRRVSICIEILTRPPLLFLDEPTSGLDSATSYHVMSRIVRLADREGMTVVGSIHQPSSEVFQLFHSLCLLAYGKTVYFGPASEASLFFATNGFPCPPLTNPSDHFLRVINKDFEKEDREERDDDDDIEAKPTSATKAIRILVRSYETSDYSNKVSDNIEDICIMEKGVVKKLGERPSFITHSMILTRRSFVNMNRDLGYYWFRIGIYTIVGICLGTIYHKFGDTFESIQSRIVMLVFISGFLTFMAIGGFPSFVEDMKIFRRERLNGHYGPAAFVIANTLSSIPFLAIISLMPGMLAYYIAGLQSEASRFSFFVLALFLCLIIVESLMMLIATLVPDYLMGIIAGAGIQGIMHLVGGFFQLPDLLPKILWKYPLHYLAFHNYANQAFFKNEFLGLELPSSVEKNSTRISGDRILKEMWHVDVSQSKWIDLGILFGMFVIYRVLFWLMINLKDQVKPTMRKGFCCNCKK